MQKKLRVSVFRDRPTRRDLVEEGKCNFIFDVEAIVPSNSYVLIGGYATESVDYNAYIKKGVKLVESNIRRDSNYILNKASDYMRKIRRGKKVEGELYKIHGKYVIPGSSFKGVIRSRIEYKFIPVKEDNVYKTFSCYSIVGYADNISRKHMNFWGEDIRLFRNSCDFQKTGSVCKVCDVFGAPGLSSRVFFSDLELIDKNYVVIVGELGGYEAYKPGSRFKGEISALNFSLLDTGILFSGLEIYSGSPVLIGKYKYRYLDNPLKIGGGRYRVGLLRLTIKDVKFLSGCRGFKRDLKWLVEESRKVLVESYVDSGYFDLEKGVLKNA